MKREDLCHTGAHKINNTIGQILLAKRSGKKRIIAETGAGQHGVATATVAAKMGMQCVVYMGEEDMKRQKLNVQRMEMLGAEVRPVRTGSRTLKDATSEAIRDWVTNVDDTFYIIGSVVGPHPYPAMVRDFQSVIGQETWLQMDQAEGALPDILVACVGGGSNAIGLFYPFLSTEARMYGVEAAGEGLETARHAATLSKGRPGVLHGSFSYLLQDEHGQVELRALDLRGAGLSGGGSGAQRAERQRESEVRGGDGHGSRAGSVPCLPGWKESCLPWKPRTRWHIWKRLCRETSSGRTRLSSTCLEEGTRISSRSPRCVTRSHNELPGMTWEE